LGRDRAGFWVQRQLAADHKHRYHDNYVPNGVSDPKYSEPRYAGNTSQTG
jgi:hypothetical protein